MCPCILFKGDARATLRRFVLAWLSPGGPASGQPRYHTNLMLCPPAHVYLSIQSTCILAFTHTISDLSSTVSFSPSPFSISLAFTICPTTTPPCRELFNR